MQPIKMKKVRSISITLQSALANGKEKGIWVHIFAIH
jgi:hypothetical protein